MDTEVFVVFIIFTSIVLLARTIADYNTKKNIIRQGLVDEKVKYLFTKSQPSNSLSSLKWGLVLVGIGTALFAEEWIDLTDEAMFGLMFLFAGIAFIIYHLFAKSEEKKDKE